MGRDVTRNIRGVGWSDTPSVDNQALSQDCAFASPFLALMSVIAMFQ
jgi:hypothetical protein